MAHNASFDVGFISHNASVLGYEFHPTVMDTVALARVLLPNLNRYKLDTVAKALNVSLENHHRAVDDAEATAGIFLKFVEMLKKQHGMETLDDLNVFNQAEDSAIMKMPTYHVIILAKNDLGRVNLYRLVSWSHVRFFSRRPRIPKSLLNQYREGLIIGSACEAGELYQAILRGGTDAELQRLVRFYDYLEIQPLGNDMFMLRDEKSTVKTVEDLKEINRKIVRPGGAVRKACVRHLRRPFPGSGGRDLPEDHHGRAWALRTATSRRPLYLRTTEEMLAEFDYLGSDQAYEVVVANTRKIADMCEPIAPVRPDKCPPVIENSDETLRKICYDRAHEMYGENLPKIVAERLERELTLHYLQWICRHVYHCPETGVEVQRGRISGGLPGLRGFVLCGHHVGDHGGKPLKSSLLLHQLPLLRLRLRGSEEIFRYGRLRYAGQAVPGLRPSPDQGRL